MDKDKQKHHHTSYVCSRGQQVEVEMAQVMNSNMTLYIDTRKTFDINHTDWFAPKTILEPLRWKSRARNPSYLLDPVGLVFDILLVHRGIKTLFETFLRKQSIDVFKCQPFGLWIAEIL